MGVFQFVILKPYLKMEGVKTYAFLHLLADGRSFHWTFIIMYRCVNMFGTVPGLGRMSDASWWWCLVHFGSITRFSWGPVRLLIGVFRLLGACHSQWIPNNWRHKWRSQYGNHRWCWTSSCCFFEPFDPLNPNQLFSGTLKWCRMLSGNSM